MNTRKIGVHLEINCSPVAAKLSARFRRFCRRDEGCAVTSSNPPKDGVLPVASLAGMKLSFARAILPFVLTNCDCERIRYTRVVSSDESPMTTTMTSDAGNRDLGVCAREWRRERRDAGLYTCVRRRLCVCALDGDPHASPSSFGSRAALPCSVSLPLFFSHEASRRLSRTRVRAWDTPMRRRMILRMVHASPNCNSGFGGDKGERRREP